MPRISLLLFPSLLAGCADFFGPFGQASLRSVHDLPSAAEIASDPCKFGDVPKCAARCIDAHDAPSCNTVGVLLEFGAERADHAGAAAFYRRACAESYAPGCNNLAWLYLLGRGVPKNAPVSLALFARAYDSYRVACNRGELDSCVAAADMLLEGRGVEADERLAKALLDDACARGSAAGCEKAKSSRL